MMHGRVHAERQGRVALNVYVVAAGRKGAQSALHRHSVFNRHTSQHVRCEVCAFHGAAMHDNEHRRVFA